MPATVPSLLILRPRRLRNRPVCLPTATAILLRLLNQERATDSAPSHEYECGFQVDWRCLPSSRLPPGFAVSSPLCSSKYVLSFIHSGPLLTIGCARREGSQPYSHWVAPTQSLADGVTAHPQSLRTQQPHNSAFVFLTAPSSIVYTTFCDL